MRLASKIFTLFVACFLVFSCAKEDKDKSTTDEEKKDETSGNGDPQLGSGTSTAPFSSLAKVPPATGAVLLGPGFHSLTAATVGLPFAPGPEDEFGNSFEKYVGSDNLDDYFASGTGSYGACELLNFARGAYGQVAEADLINCILGKTIDEKLTGNEFKVFSLDVGEGEVYKFRIRKVTGDDGNIKAVEMMMCVGDVQESYFAQDFSGDKVEFMFRGRTQPENPSVDFVSYAADLEADGVNADGYIIGKKTLLYRYQNLFSNGANNHVIANITQDPTTFTYNGMTCNKETLSAGTCDSPGGSQQLFGYAEILDHNPEGQQSPNLFAIGDGAAYIKSSAMDGIQQWGGDTGNVDNASINTFGEYVTTNMADAQEVATDFTEITFTTDQSWDCSGDAEAIAMDEAIFGQCGILSVDQNVHLECGGGGNANLSYGTLSE